MPWHNLVIALACVTAVTVAIRSTWSPCGVSMLSTLTPLSERGRGHRWRFTVAWYITGATLGGAALGALLAGPAALLAAVPAAPAAVLIAVTAVAALLTDLRITPFRLPGHRRQVDETWIGRYRQWVYVAGFGAQIGLGFATVFMTGALYLFAALLLLTGSPLATIAVAALFGAVRGSAICTGYRLTDSVVLRAFHRRFDALAPWSIALVVATEVIVVVFVGAAFDRVGAAAVVAAVPLLVFAVQQRRRSRASAPNPLVLPIAVARVPAPQHA